MHAPSAVSHARRRSLFADRGAQAVHRLRMQLRYPRLGHAEHGADLFERAALLVIEREDLLELRRELLDPIGDRAPHLMARHRLVDRLALGDDLLTVHVEHLEPREAGLADARE